MKDPKLISYLIELIIFTTLIHNLRLNNFTNLLAMFI